MFRRQRQEKDKGIYLGRLLEGKRIGEEVWYNKNTHIVTIGPNRSGKGTGLITTTIATAQRSIINIDPKLEQGAITARRRAARSRVRLMNPFNILADELPHLRSQGFNPLADIDEAHDNFTDDAAGISEAAIKEPPGNDGAFFGGSAQDFGTCAIMLEKIRNGREGNLANVRRMITQPFSPSGLFKTLMEMSESSCVPLSSKAGRFLTGNKSTLDIVSTAGNETRFLDSPPVQRDLSGPGFDWNICKREETTIYISLPADRLQTHANYLRLVVASALRTLLRSPPSGNLPSVLMILDEFAQLNYLAPIENAMGIAAGFGVQLWIILQDLNQLKALYKDRWQTFIGNAGIITAYAPRDLFTATYLSDLCGKHIRNVRSRSITGRGEVNWNDAPHEFARYRPEDLMRLPPGVMLCIATDVPLPFFTFVEGYWNTPYGRDLDPNPYYRG